MKETIMADTIKGKLQEAGNTISETAQKVGNRVSEKAEEAKDWGHNDEIVSHREVPADPA